MSVHQQSSTQGRLASFTSSTHETTKKKSLKSGINGGGRRWKPTAFDFRHGSMDGAPCPTCHGTGLIPKGQENELVALIPYNDKRLKPRRTCLYMSILVAALLAVGGLLTAFLYPRNVDLTVMSIAPVTNISDTVGSHINDQDIEVYLEIMTTVKIKNSNFFPVTVSTLNVSLTNAQVQVGHISEQSFVVNSRATKMVNIVQNATFKTALARRTKTVCMSGTWDPYIYVEASVVLGYIYLSHSSDALANKIQRVDCHGLRLSIPAYTLGPTTDHHITTSHDNHVTTTPARNWL